MPLTVRTNGSSSPNIITASWFNDIRDLLTGTMQDQEVTIKNNLVLSAIGAGPSVAPSGSLAAGSTLGIGAYQYVYTWVTADGETIASPVFNITTTSGNQKVNLTSIAVGPTGTTARNVYRTKVGATSLLLLTQIADNVTTTFSDTTADASLTTAVPVSPSFGGSMLGKNSAGTEVWRLFNDGRASLLGPQTTVNGSVSGTVTAGYPIWGPGLKIALVTLTNFQSVSLPTFNFPSAFVNEPFVMSQYTGVVNWSPLKVGASQNTLLTATLGTSGGGTTSSQSNVQGASMGVVQVVGIDGIKFNAAGSPASHGIIIIMGD